VQKEIFEPTAETKGKLLGLLHLFYPVRIWSVVGSLYAGGNPTSNHFVALHLVSRMSGAGFLGQRVNV